VYLVVLTVGLGYCCIVGTLAVWWSGVSLLPVGHTESYRGILVVPGVQFEKLYLGGYNLPEQPGILPCRQVCACLFSKTVRLALCMVPLPDG
jgi:hypothetical protein